MSTLFAKRYSTDEMLRIITDREFEMNLCAILNYGSASFGAEIRFTGIDEYEAEDEGVPSTGRIIA